MMVPIVFDAAPPGRAVDALADWRDRVRSALADPVLKGAGVGVVVRRTETGEVLFRRDGEKALIPASNMKLPTAAAALALLGDAYRYRTRVVRSGSNLWIVGAGDPTIDGPALEKLADAVAAKLKDGERVTVHGDDSAFEPDFLGAAWQWDDMAFDYSAPFGALVRDRSTARLEVLPTRPGTPAIVRWPEGAGPLNGTVTTVPGSETRIASVRSPGSPALVVSGTIGAVAPAWSDRCAVSDPTGWCVAGLVDALRMRGIDGFAGTRCAAPENAAIIAEHASDPLHRLVVDFLLPSDNLMGECLLRTIGRGPVGPGSARTGAERVLEWCRQRHLPLEGVNLIDGSGLSMQDTLTADFLAALLVELREDRAFRAALPIAGKTGTLRNRLQGPPTEGAVAAKTGSLTVASSLSGYVRTKSGEILAFAILMNQFDRKGGSRAARAVQDAIVRALIEVPRQASRGQSERRMR